MNAATRILAVDDDAPLRELLKEYLETAGFEVTAVGDGTQMHAALEVDSFDLIILDLMLPDSDGLTLAREVRARFDYPIIMLSARGEDVDRIVGLEVGADDYLAKPFNPRELLARIRAVLRRTPASVTTTEVSEFGPFRLDFATRTLRRDGTDVALTTGEYNLLELLTRHPNRVLSRDAILQALKGYEHNPYDRSIDVQVTRLRRKIEDDPANPHYICTVRGAGYRFVPHGSD